MFFLVLILFAIAGTTPAQACTCAPNGSPQESLAKASAVFAGRVVDSGFLGKVASAIFPDVKLKFEVSEFWKGPVSSMVVLSTPADSASCGYKFVRGEEYLVYAFGTGNNLNTSICTRTRLLSAATGDLQELGRGKFPTETGAVSSGFNAVGVGLGIIGVLIGVLLISKKGKKAGT